MQAQKRTEAHHGGEEETAMDVLDPMTAAYALQRSGYMPVELDGWDDHSLWAWDEQGGYLFAQLWRNTDDDREAPTVWITPGGWPATSDPEQLAAFVAIGTMTSVPAALLALASGAPAELKAHLEAVAALPDPDDRMARKAAGIAF
jgi:hypothetical protein